MNRIVKICTIIFGLLCVFILISNISFAYDYSGLIKNADTAFNKNGGNAATSTKNLVGAIISVVRIISVGVAIIMLVVLAIKYMSSAPNDRAEIKKHAVVYVVGAVVVFASSGILGIIRDFAGNIK